ncbi:MAG: hypothetical protein U0L77_01530 [Prevotellamassilia sp.]|nr:hypothetical protein [Prevotellamassilia sp.]
MNEFSIKTLLCELLAFKKQLIINLGIAAVLGIVVAFSIPKMYYAQTSIVYEAGDENSLGGLGSMASMVGLSLGNTTDAIGPDLYKDLITTNKFITELLPVNVETKDGEQMTFADYLKKKTRMPWWSMAFMGVKNGIVSLLSDKKPATDETLNPKMLSVDQEGVVKGLRSLINCSINEKTGVITLGFSAQDPLVATTMVDTIMIKLRDAITAYRTNKARIDMEYYQGLELQAQEDLERCRKAYSTFTDAHQDVRLQSYLTQARKLENDLQIATSGYTQIKQQVQLAQAKVQESTPAFTVLEDSSVPNRANSPKKILILFAYLFVTFIGSMGYVYVKLLFKKPSKEESL